MRWAALGCSGLFWAARLLWAALACSLLLWAAWLGRPRPAVHVREEEPETPRIDQSSSRVHEGTWLVDSSPLEGQRALAVVVDAVDGSQVGPLNPNRPTVDESQVEDLGVSGNQDPRHLSAGVGVDHPRASVTASTLYQTPRGCHSSRSSASRTGSSSSRCLV